MIEKPFTHEEYAELGERLVDALGVIQALGHVDGKGLRFYVGRTGDPLHDVVLDALDMSNIGASGVPARERVEAFLWDRGVPQHLAQKVATAVAR